MTNRNEEGGVYLEGEVQVKYYLDGEDFTDTYTSYYAGTTSEDNTPKVIYCSSFKVDDYLLGSDGNRITDSDGNIVEGLSLYYKYYVITTSPYSKQQKTKAITFPTYTGLKIDNILPGPTRLWSYNSNDDKYHSLTASTSGPIEVYFLTDEDARYNINVTSSDTNKGTVAINPLSSSGYKINDAVTITANGKTGYKFSKWGVKKITGNGVELDEPDITINPYSFNVIANRNYTAYFEPKSVNIDYLDHNGNYINSNAATYGEPMPTRIPPSIAGYNFLGYYTEKDGKGTKYYNSDGTSAHVCDFNTTDGGRVNLYAYVELITYTIKYNLNGGTGEMTPTTYTVETATFNLPTPTKQNYSFVGWYKNDKFTGSMISQITKGTTGNQEYWAKWYEDNGRIATNEYIYNLCAYSNTSAYQLSTSGDYVEDKCPTRSHILSNYGGQLINIPGSYSYDQCVKESDLSLKSRTINFIIRNSTGSPMNETTISMYENGGSTKTHSVTWPSTNNENSGDVSNSYTINSDNFSKFGSSLKFKWDANYIVGKRLQCQFNNGFLSKTIKLNGNDSLTLLGGSVDFEIEEKLEFFIKISNSTANIIFIITQK